MAESQNKKVESTKTESQKGKASAASKSAGAKSTTKKSTTTASASKKSSNSAAKTSSSKAAKNKETESVKADASKNLEAENVSAVLASEGNKANEETLNNEVVVSKSATQVNSSENVTAAKESENINQQGESLKQENNNLPENKDKNDTMVAGTTVNEVSETPRKKTTGEIVSFWVSIGLCVLMLPLLLVNLVLIFKSVIYPNDLPSIFGYKPLIVMSDSMYPQIKTNDLIFSKVVEPSTLKVGDVITFREEGGGVVTHKILAILDDNGTPYFQTGGINNYQRNPDGTPYLNESGNRVIVPDTEPVYYDQVEGLYVSRMAGFGGFIYWMQSTWGLIVCIGIPLIAFVVYGFIRYNASLKEQKQNADSATNELEELRKKLAQMEGNSTEPQPNNTSQPSEVKNNQNSSKGSKNKTES